MHDDTLSRREFLGTGIAMGFAVAAGPIGAAVIRTSGEGLAEGRIEIPTSGGRKMPGYFARPKSGGPFPTILVIHEIFGVHQWIQDVCRRFAKVGYLAVAPSLYFRQGDATKVEDIRKLIAQIVSKVPQEQVMWDLDATLKWSAANRGDGARVGVTGFCWGGNATWMYAAHDPRLKAGVAWYGPLVGEPTPLKPKFPVDIAPTLKVPVLGLYGGKDSHITADHVDKMRAALAKGKSGSEIVVFPQADHGFLADYRPSYHEKAAKEGWDKALAWFRKHGV